MKNRIRAAKNTSVSLHFTGNQTAPQDDSEDLKVTNHQQPGELFDPEELSGGDTHWTENTPKNKRLKVQAGKISKRALRAGTDTPAQDDTTNIADIPQDENAAEDYLPNDGETILATEDEELVDGDNEQQMLEIDGSNDDDADDDLGEDDELDLTDDEVPEESEEFEAEEVEASEDPDALPIVDIDGMDDGADSVVFAMLESDLLAIKAKRIIASLSRAQALHAGIDDIYEGPEFEQVVEAQIQKQGLRAGLKSAGFKMATVNVASSRVINQRVQAATSQIKANLQRQEQVRDKNQERAVAIASVGLNRRFWNDVPNTLRASLESELAAAGIHGAGPILARAFANHGHEYVMAALNIAKQVSALPETVQASYVSALNLSDGFASDEEETDACSVYAEDETDMDQSFGDEDFGSSDIMASLARPGRRSKSVTASVNAGSTKYSGTRLAAAAILNGDKPLSF